jgi:hypothetical protein
MRELELSVEELFAEVATQAGAHPAFIPGQRLDHLVEEGKLWLRQSWSDLNRVLCSSSAKRILDTKSTEQEAALAVADLIAGVITSVAPFTVAVLLLRLGLERLCREGPP